jgi:hypothetical protein
MFPLLGFKTLSETFAIIQSIFEDGLTKDVFFQRVGKVANAGAVVRWVISKKLDEPPPPEQVLH